jgi:hypothetical protein
VPTEQDEHGLYGFLTHLVSRDHIQILITNSNYPSQAHIEKNLPSLVCEGGGGRDGMGVRRCGAGHGDMGAQRRRRGTAVAVARRRAGATAVRTRWRPT